MFAKGLNSKGGERQFRFQSFTDRINSIDIDVAHRIREVEIAPADENDSFFNEALQRWRELDCTASFQAFNRDVYTFVKSLPMLLLNRDTVIECLLDHILMPDSTSLEALLDLTSVLARDLRHEFAPYFPRFFRALIYMIDGGATASLANGASGVQNTDRLEYVFRCLSFLFKFLAKQLVEQLPALFPSLFHRILSHKKDYVRHFAAESIAFLVRKARVRDVQRVFQAIASVPPVLSVPSLPVSTLTVPSTESAWPLPLEARPHLRDGIAHVFFESFRGVEHGFHSSAAERMPILLQCTENDSDSAHCDAFVAEALRLLCDHSRMEQSAPVWEILLAYSQRCLQAFSAARKASGDMSSACDNLARSLRFLTVFVLHRWGTRVSDAVSDQITSILRLLLVTPAVSCPPFLDPAFTDAAASAALSLFVALWRARRSRFARALANGPLLAALFGAHQHHAIRVAAAVRSLRAIQHTGNDETADEEDHSISDFDQLVAPHAAAFSSAVIQSHPDLAIHMLMQITQTSEENADLPLPVAMALRSLRSTAVSTHLLNTLTSKQSDQSYLHIAHIWAALQLTPLISMPLNEVLPPLIALFDKFNDLCATNQSPAFDIVVEQGVQKVCERDSRLVLRADAFVALRAECSRTLMRVMCSNSKTGTNHKGSSHSMLNAAFFARFVWPLLNSSDNSDETSSGSHPVALRAISYYFHIAHKEFASLGVVAGPSGAVDALFKTNASMTASAKKPSKVQDSMVQTLCSAVAIDSDDVISFLRTLFFGAAQKLWQPLLPLLASPLPAVRRHTIDILNTFPPLQFERNLERESIFVGECKFIDLCHQLIHTQVTLAAERAITLLMRQLVQMAISRRLPAIYAQALPHVLIGILRIKLSVLWPAVHSQLGILSGDSDSQSAAYLFQVLDQHIRHASAHAGVLLSVHDPKNPVPVAKPAEEECEGANELSESFARRVPEPLTARLMAAPCSELSSVFASSTSSSVHNSKESHALLLSVRSMLLHPLNHPRTQPLSASALNAQTDDEDDWSGVEQADAAETSDESEDDSLLTLHDEVLPQCTDRITFLEQLYRAVHSVPSSAALIEAQCGGSFARRFLFFVRSQYNRLYPVNEHSVPLSERLQIVSVTGARRVVTLRLHWFLRTLGAFKSSKRMCGITETDTIGTQVKTRVLSVLFELLAKSDPPMQQLALECLNKFQLTYLHPYREPLSKLIAEASFRDELTMFSIAPSSGQIAAEHRAAFLPILITVLYSKIVSRKNKGTGGGGSGTGFNKTNRDLIGARRAAIFAYLTAAAPSELAPLLDLVLGAFLPVLKDDTQSIEQKAWRDAPLTTQLGFLRVFGEMIHQMRAVIRDYLRPLLHATLYILHHALHVDAENTPDDSERERYRDVRQQAFRRLGECLEAYSGQTKLQSSSSTVKALLALDTQTPAPVWFFDPFFAVAAPAIGKLAAQSTQSRAGLLEALVVMSRHSRYLPRLIGMPAKKSRKSIQSVENQRSTLTDVFALMSARNVSPDVLSAVVEIVENLLDHRDVAQANLANSADRTMSDEQSDQDEWKLTETLVDSCFKRHTAELLTGFHAMLERRLVSSPAQNGRKKAGKGLFFPRRELTVLSRLAPYITDSDSACAAQMTALLLPFLRDTYAHRPDAQSLVFAVLQDMVPLLDSEAALTCLQPFSRQLLVLSSAAARTQLMSTFTGLAPRLITPSSCNGLTLHADIIPIISDLNAMDSSRIGEYNFDRRAAAHKRISALLSCEQLTKSDTFELMNQRTMHLLPPLAHTLLHDLSEDDFALRSASSLSLNLMINMCLQMFGSEQTPDLVTSILYQAIVRAVAGRNNDRARKEYLSLLSNLGKAFPSATLLRDVCLLQHADVDLDFFANFCHIQLHRRRRALQRAAQLADQLGPSSVEKVLIPLCMHIVYETTSAVNSASASSSIGGGTASKTASTVAASEGALVDEAVRTIGALSGCLGWTAYYRLVSSVLKPIRTHPQHLKVLVRVLCAIVDRFHFEVAEPSGSAPFEREKKPMNRGNVAVTDAFDPANSTVHRQTNIRDRIQARLAAREAEMLAHELSVLERSARKSKALQHDSDDEADDEPAEISTTTDADQEMNDGEQSDDDDDEEMETSEESIKQQEVQAEAERQSQAERIHRVMTTRFLPQLHRHLMENKTFEMVRAPVALAIVRLLMHLPKQALAREFPRLLTVLCNQCASRVASARVQARSTLIDVATSVGAAYFHFVLEELRRALKRGYQEHVLGHTIHALLLAVLKQFEPGAIDYCLSDLINLLLTEINGTLADDKAATELKQSLGAADMKGSKAPDSFELLARGIKFANVRTLVDPIRDALRTCADARIVRRLENVLRRIGVGLQTNPTTTSSDLLIFCHFLIETHMAARVQAAAAANDSRSTVGAIGSAPLVGKKSKKEYVLFGDKPKSTVEKPLLHTAPTVARRSREEALAVIPSARVAAAAAAEANIQARKLNDDAVVIFALQLLLSSFKRNRLGSSNLPANMQLSMLDPFVSQCVTCMRLSPSPLVHTLALRCLMCLLRVPNLPALAKHIQEIGEFVFKCVQGQSQGGHGIELVQASFRAMASLVRRFDAFEITEAQTKAMVGFVQEDIENYKKQSQAFSVLKSLLARRVMLPELYDLMQRVASLLIRSQDAVTQQHCAHLIVTFVLNYPLGAKRMQQQLEFFINQLEYENSTGRQAAVETMTALFRRLPSETLLSQADLVFFPLVLRLVNDDSRDIRQLVSVALKTLLQRCEAAQLTRLLGFALTWSAAGQQAVMRLAGIQVLGICFEAFTGSDSSKVQKFAVQLLPLVKAVFETEALALDAAVEAYVAQGSTALSTLESQWQLVYHSMLALEKCWKTLPALTEREIKNQKVWPLLQQLSLHPHVWIRTAAARLSGLFYSHILPVIQRSKEFNFKDSLLGSEASAFEAAQHTCSILNSKTVDSKLGEQCISNLVCLSMLLYTSNAQVQLPSTEIESERVPVLASSASLPAEGALEVVSRTRVEKLDEQNQSDDDEGDVEQESEHDELSEDEASEEQSDSDAEKSSKKRAVDVDVESDAEEADEDQVNSEHEQDEPESEAELSESEQDDEVNDTAAKSSRVRHSVFDIAELAMTDSSVAKNRALNWIFHRMSFLSRKASPQTLEYIFQWFATMITQLGSAGIKPYVLPIMFPLHRISSVETTSPRLQQCIEQVMEVLRTVIGATATLEVHAQVRDAVNRVRADRKTARAAQSVTNPQAFAKRKLAQASRKRDAKKRRMEAVKAERRGERPTTALTAKPKQEVVEYDEEGDRIVRVKNPVTLKQAKQQQKRRRTDDQ